MIKPDGGPVHPTYRAIANKFRGETRVSIHGGMTLREYYAGQMMAARLSNPELDERASAEDFADDAIKCADALIAALNKDGGE